MLATNAKAFGGVKPYIQTKYAYNIAMSEITTTEGVRVGIVRGRAIGVSSAVKPDTKTVRAHVAPTAPRPSQPGCIPEITNHEGARRDPKGERKIGMSSTVIPSYTAATCHPNPRRNKPGVPNAHRQKVGREDIDGESQVFSYLISRIERSLQR